MNNKRRVAIGFIITLYLCIEGVLFCGWYKSTTPYRMEVFSVEGGYGYRIYKNDKAFIYQPFVPVFPNMGAFASEEDARYIGSLVLKRIEAGEDFAVTEDDLNERGIFAKKE